MVDLFKELSENWKKEWNQILKEERKIIKKGKIF
jgi:hypothetical protein